MKPKMTGWFPASINPVHVGWYPVEAPKGNCYFSDNVTGATVKRTKRYWDGLRWKWRNEKNRMVNAGIADEDQWRGFAEEQR